MHQQYYREWVSEWYKYMEARSLFQHLSREAIDIVLVLEHVDREFDRQIEVVLVAAYQNTRFSRQR